MTESVEDNHALFIGSHPPSTSNAAEGLGVTSYFVALAQCVCVYYGVAVLLHFILPAIIRTRSLQGGKQKGKDTWRDALRSFPPLLIKALSLFVAELLHSKGFDRLTDESLFEVVWDLRRLSELAFMVVLMDLFHDTWFYFTHRLLHTPWMIRNVHYMHHQSTVPSAFTGLEACMVFSVAIVEGFIFPIPLMLQRSYELYMVAIHVGGHCGYEMAPFVPHILQVVGAACSFVLKHMMGIKLGRLTSLINNVEHHDMHHKYIRCHFSLYYTHWDYVCGTMHPKYIESHCRPDDK